jgi:hypothetical protein
VILLYIFDSFLMAHVVRGKEEAWRVVKNDRKFRNSRKCHEKRVEG